MQAWAKKFGFGQPAGLDIGGEESGLLPTPAWRKAVGRTAWDKAWNPGDMIQMAIGQKDINVTPLQMARFYAALANGASSSPRTSVQAAERPAAEGEPAVPVLSLPPRRRRRRSASIRPRSPSCATASTRRATTRTGPRRASSAASRSGCRQDRYGGEGRQPAGISDRPPRGSGVVVRLGPIRRQRLRQLPRREADADRRLRRDRERRPRRLGRRPGGAEGLRALVPRAGRRPRRGCQLSGAD